VTLQVYRSSILHYYNPPSSESDYQYLEDGFLIVENGKVKKVCTTEELSSEFPSDLKINHYENHLIMPGFIDTHVHYPQIDMIASHGEQLLEWLEKYTFPAESKFGDEGYASFVAEFFIQELMRNGVTTAMAFPTVHKESVNALFKAASKINMRMITGKVLTDRNVPQNLLDTPELGYQQSKDLIEAWHGQDRLQYAVTPRFAPTSTEQQLTMCAKLLKEFPGVYLQTHLAENKKELEWVKELFPWAENYLHVYDKFELLSERSIFAHGIYLSDDQFKRLGDTGSSIAFCPTSNLFIGSGLFNLAKAEEFNVKVGLASDVGAGTSLSMFQTLNEAYKVLQLQEQSLCPLKAFYMATLGSARSLTLDSHIGNFEVGKEADFVVLDLKATPLIEYRMQHCNTLSEKLFVLMMLGDDRAVAETYVMGNKI